jgi:hypothetical protein
MSEFVRAIFGMGLLLVAIVPVLTWGAGLIAAFMTGQQILKSLVLTVLALAALLLGALLAAALAQADERVWAAVALAAIPWAVQGAVLWWARRQQPKPPSQQA